jgi:hypothetical protein
LDLESSILLMWQAYVAFLLFFLYFFGDTWINIA